MATTQEVTYCIDIISKYAIENYKYSKVLPSLVIAQACYEGGYLTSELSTNAFNPFGMKYNSKITDEYYTYRNMKWCKFKSFKQAVESQGKFYNLYERYKGIPNEQDIEKVLNILEKSGYCENSGYSVSVKNIIDRYNLLEYDKEVISNNKNEYEVIDIRNDNIYQNALSVFVSKGIVTKSVWESVINTKHTESLVIKTCQHLYGINNYKDGVQELTKQGILTSSIWENPKYVKATHLRSFIIKLSKIL